MKSMIFFPQNSCSNSNYVLFQDSAKWEDTMLANPLYICFCVFVLSCNFLLFPCRPTIRVVSLSRIYWLCYRLR